MNKPKTMDYQVENVRVLPVVGYEGLYEVTSEGEVYSLNYHKTARQLVLNNRRISECCTGKRKITGGYHFRFYVP